MDGQGQEHLVRWEEEPGLWFQGGTRGQCEPKGFQAMLQGFRQPWLGDVIFSVGSDVI